MKFTNIATVGNLEFNDLGMVTKGVSLQPRYITLLPGESEYLPDGQDVMYSAQQGDAYKYQKAGLLSINDVFVLTATSGLTPAATIAHGFGYIPTVKVAQFNNAANTTGGVTVIQSNNGSYTAGSITVTLYVNQTTVTFPTQDPAPAITPAVSVTQTWSANLSTTLSAIATKLQTALRAYIGADTTSTVASSGTALTITPKKGSAVLGNQVQAYVSWTAGATDTVTFWTVGPWLDIVPGAEVLAINTDQSLLNTTVINLSTSALTWMVRIS